MRDLQAFPETVREPMTTALRLAARGEKAELMVAIVMNYPRYLASCLLGIEWDDKLVVFNRLQERRDV